jgi:hypothetical protein
VCIAKESLSHSLPVKGAHTHKKEAFAQGPTRNAEASAVPKLG